MYGLEKFAPVLQSGACRGSNGVAAPGIQGRGASKK